MIVSLAALVVAQALPEPTVPPWYLAAWVVVAFIGGTPGVVAAVLSSRNKKEIDSVRYQVMPNGGGSSFDLLHRLVWETHERTEPLGDLVKRVEALESHPCPYSPKETSS